MILALYGAGAMGREFKYIAEERGTWERIVFIDDASEHTEILGCPVYRFQMFREKFKPEEIRFVVAIGEPKFRLEAFEKMKRAGYTGAVLAHASAYISPDAEIGEGTALCHNAYVGSCSKVGANCFLSRNVSIGHDARVDDHTRFGVGAFVGGHAVIGTNAYIGAGAMLRDRVHIGNKSIVAMGAAVFEDVPDSVTVIGNPARISGEGVTNVIYAPSTALESLKNTDTIEEKSIRERYWDVFSDCFEGVDFNPVTFRYHDNGWDSLAQMMLIEHLEQEFSISLKGREAMKLKSYADGLRIVETKLKQTDGGH